MASVPAVPVSAEANTPLGAMLLQYEDLDQRIAVLTEQQESLKQQIKDAARQSAPGATAIALDVAGTNVRYEVNYRESWRINGKSLAATDPLAYAQHGRKVTSWELRRVKS